MREQYFRSFLKAELARRCDKNSSYSLRSFSRALDINVATLSQILAGKQVPSFKVATKLMGALEISPDQERRFMASVAHAQSENKKNKLHPALQNWMDAERATDSTQELSLELFKAISDWYHYGILELTFVKGFKCDARWIAKRLGISQTLAQQAIERLVALGLLEKDSKGVWRKSKGYLRTADRELTNSALKRHQRQVIEKSLESLEKDSIQSRYMFSTVYPLDPSRLSEAKKAIEEFSKKFCIEMDSESPTQVYGLSVSLFPLSKNEGVEL